MKEYPFKIDSNDFGKATDKYTRDIYVSPLQSKEIESLRVDVYIQAISSVGLMIFVVALFIHALHTEYRSDSVVDIVIHVIALILSIFAMARLTGLLATILKRRGYHFSGLILTDSAYSLGQLAPATPELRVKLAEAIQDSPVLMSKIGGLLKLVKERARDITVLEINFCLALCESQEVEDSFSKANDILERAIIGQEAHL